MRTKKRSSCASGSGNVPSYSIGFCVAMTRNGVGEQACDSVDGHLLLGHRLEQRGLRLRHRAVDLVDEDDVREHRPGPELEVPLALVEDREAGDVGRLQVGRALDPGGVRSLDRLRDRPGEHRLRGARHVLEQHVASADERRDDELDLLALAVDDGLDVVQQPARHLIGFGVRLDCQPGLPSEKRPLRGA